MIIATRLWFALVLSAAFGAACGAQPVALVSRRGDAYVVSGAGYEARFSAVDGSLLLRKRPGGSGAILRSGEYGLWRLRFRDGSFVSAADFGGAGRRIKARAEAKAGVLRLIYQGQKAAVAVTVTGSRDWLELAAEVTPTRDTVLGLELPARLRFDPGSVRRFVSPVDGNQGVGVAFRRAFFLPQPEDSPSAWQQDLIGPAGYADLFGGPLVQREVQDPATALKVTEEGRAWLGEGLARTLAAARAVVNRPPTRDQASLVLVDSANGPWLSAHRVGQGALWRIGGAVGEAEKPLALESMAAVLRRLTDTAPAERTEVGILSVRNGPESGGWAAVPVQAWLESMRGLPAVRSGRLQLKEIASPGELAAALGSDRFVALLNPYGEACPALPGGMPATTAAIGRYVRAGGQWLEVGGYPFFYALRPVRTFSFSGPYPPLFADFQHLDATTGSASIYRVQPLPDEPWTGARDHTALFVPGSLGCGADERGGYADRAYATFVLAGSSWRSPRARIVVGSTAEAQLAEYCRANRIRRTLEDKVAGPALERLKRAVLVYYAGSAREKIEHLGLLPPDTLLHFADYLHGGFDKQYPDHLPPNPAFGTPAELAAFFQRARAAGRLVMPYTNPTWWCDHPKGPTFAREGDAPLLKGLDGKPVYERYGPNDGWTVTQWHPAVRAANRITVQQFSREYPVDVLFQDQCGARSWMYDTNPASPTPYAYTDGILSMIAQDSRVRPLSTEAGWDRVVNWETQLCGLSWALVPTEYGPEWRRYMKQVYPPSTWEIYPLAQYVAHDKAMLLLHDLGQFVTNREVLSWALGLGFSLSYSVPAAALRQDGPREWLRWLDRLQKSVVARTIGRPVLAFRHERGPSPTRADDGLIAAQYGRVRVWANLGPGPRPATGRMLAPHGFLAQGPGVVAGVTTSAEGDTAFVSEGAQGRADLWVYGPGEQQVRAELPSRVSGPVRLAWDGGAHATVAAKAGTLAFRLPAASSVGRTTPPAGLAGKAPRDWPGGRPAIAVLALEGNPPQTWTRIAPEDWLRAFRVSPLATDLGAPVRAITSLDALNAALDAGPTVTFAIVNPYGEGIPEAAPGQWKATLARIRAYVEKGGCWWETAGYSFHAAFYPTGSGWASEEVGAEGLASLGIPIGGGPVDAPPVRLAASDEALSWLGVDLRRRIAEARSPVNRSLPRGANDPGHVTLVKGDGQDFIGGYRLNGWGWFWRIGGFWPDPAVALPVVVAATQTLYTHAPMPVRSGGTSRLWHARATW